MSRTGVDQPPPVPAESHAPLSSSSEPATEDGEQERREDEVHGSCATVQPPPTTSSITLQPSQIPRPLSGTSTNPHNDNANWKSMLDPDTQLSIVETWTSSVRQVASLRDIILTARMDVKKERTRCYQQEQYFESLMDSFMALVISVIEHGNYLQCKNDLDDLSTRMRGSREELKVLRQRSSGIEDGLSNHEYKLSKLEQEIYQQVDTEFRLGSVNTALSTSQASIATQQAPQTTPPSAPRNPRDELYSRMGDLRILLDRLNDFEFELRQELDERDVLRAAGQIDIPSDTVFFEETRAERAKMQTELEEAQADVEQLKQQCRRQGIEFPDVQFHNPFHNDADLDDTFSRPSTRAEAATLPLPDSPSGILNSFFSATERVTKWLRDPSSSNPNQGNNRAGEDNDSRQRRESCSDADWELPHSWPAGKRPSSTRSAGDCEAQHGRPVWTAGVMEGPQEIEALLEEGVENTTQQGSKHIRKHESIKTL